MASLPARAVEAFLRKPDPQASLVLVYGPDTGLVSERARAVVAASVDDIADPFQMVKLDGDALASDPARLADEALTVPLFGGRRAIWVRAGSRPLAAAVQPLVGEALRDCRVVIEGGDWKKSNPLIGLLDKARNAAVIACYGDEGAAIGQIIAAEVAEAGLTIAPEARDLLAGLLGGDRLASRSEVRKLALYAHGAGRIELSDVEAVVGDASLLAVDEIIDAAFGGRPDLLDPTLAKAWREGTNASVLAGTALRHAMMLHRLRAEVDKGRPPAGVVEAAGGQVHFKRRAAVAAQLGHLDAGRIARIVDDLAATVLEARRNAVLGEALTGRALMRVALGTRRR